MSILTQLTGGFRQTLRNQLPVLLRPFNLQLLDRDQTQAFLQPSLLTTNPGDSLELASVTDLVHPATRIFSPLQLVNDPTYVWAYQNQGLTVRQRPNGSLTIGPHILDTDFGAMSVVTDLFRVHRRAVVEGQTVLAPWTHYWGGYYDYLFFVAAKLCRMKEALPEAVFANALVSYPLLHTPFETAILEQLGINDHNRIDSRRYSVRGERWLVGNAERSFFFPSQADIALLKKHLFQPPTPRPDAPARIYISRAGRRRVLNETALMAMLVRYGFTLIEDKPRSLSEQMALYGQASFIVGPHGASFANMLWCQPGTQLVELFAPTYYPKYYWYLAQVLGVGYWAHSAGWLGVDSQGDVDADLLVDVAALEGQLVRLLESQG